MTRPIFPPNSAEFTAAATTALYRLQTFAGLRLEDLVSGRLGPNLATRSDIYNVLNIFLDFQNIFKSFYTK